jgi:hypothetical protein
LNQFEIKFSVLGASQKSNFASALLRKPLKFRGLPVLQMVLEWGITHMGDGSSQTALLRRVSASAPQPTST